MKPRISILLVDDLEKKRSAISTQLKARLKRFDVAIEYAERYESARDRLLSQNFDFVILDIMIPAGTEPASEKWSRQLLRDIVEQTLCFPMHVFGVTAHTEIADAERQFYEENLFGFFVFDWNSNEWAARIAAKIDYLSQAIENGAAYRLNSYDYDLLILTARFPTEFCPIRERLFGRQKDAGHPLWPERSFFGTLPMGASKRKLRTALLCIGGTGLSPAASITTQAIQVLRPRTVAMLGMCAGFPAKQVRVMDALIARQTACWQEGKSFGDDEGEKFDPRGIDINCSPALGEKIDVHLEMSEAELSARLDEFSREKKYIELRAKYGRDMAGIPKAISGLVVSGSEVVASKETTDEVRRRHPKALGLEMEIYAVYTAAILALGKKPEFIAIKGVADFGDKEKKDLTQKLASELSAEVLKFLVAKAAI